MFNMIFKFLHENLLVNVLTIILFVSVTLLRAYYILQKKILKMFLYFYKHKRNFMKKREIFIFK